MVHGIEGDIEDDFQVEIDIPPEYPNVIPTVKEVGGRIPDDYHRLTNGNLCLGTVAELYLSFTKNPTLLHYVQKHIVDYLYGFSYKEKYGRHPSGERAHGIEGVWEYYRERFQTNNDLAVISLLYILCSNKYRGHQLCPCGSGKKIRQCHLPFVLELSSESIIQHYQGDLLVLINDFKERKK